MFDNKAKSAPKDNRFLYLDMNSYFASCEQQNNPKYQNKPLVVAPFNGPTGTIIASSFEAKKFGIKTGMKVKEALELNPNLVIVNANTNLYRTTHRKIIEIINQFTPWFRVKSIDELVISLSASEQLGNTPYQIAHDIKQTFRAQLGPHLTCSIGIGPNIFIAKQASNITKKDGLNSISLTQLPEFYQHAELKSLTGIGRGMLTRLNQIGIYNSYQFFQAEASFLRQKLGMTGEYWFLKLHGYLIEDNAAGAAKSLSHSHVLSPDQRDWLIAQKVLQSLAEKCGDRLRKNGLMTQQVALSISFLKQPTWQNKAKTSAINDNLSLYQLVKKLWRDAPRSHQPYKISIWTTNLINQSALQLNLFEPTNKKHNLSQLIDSINLKSKHKIIYSAALIEDKDLAPDRISFGNTR